MGIIKSFVDATKGALSDQWIDVVTAGPFDERVVVAPGVFKEQNNGRGSNTRHSDSVISSGSRILVPENTAAFIFKQTGIETVITEPGQYVYEDGEKSIFYGRPEGKGIFDHVIDTVVDQTMERTKFGGMPAEEARVAFVNLREVRGLRFGTRGPLVYNDLFYKCDLEIFAYGKFSVQVVDAEKFVRNFVPPMQLSYTFDDKDARSQLIGEFLQSFAVALNGLSSQYRIAQLPSQASSIASAVMSDAENVGTWAERFGLRLAKIGVENIEFSDASREFVAAYNEHRMGVAAYENTTREASDMAAQQKIASGIQENGFGDGGAGMIFGMNLASGLDAHAAERVGAGERVGVGTAAERPAASIDDQIASLIKLKELLDADILTQEEFDAKKREVLGTTTQ